MNSSSHGVPAPPDAILKLSIERAAYNTALNPMFEESLRMSPAMAEAFRFAIDPNAEGYAYYRFCVDVCRSRQQQHQQPSVLTLQNLPPTAIPDPPTAPPSSFCMRLGSNTTTASPTPSSFPTSQFHSVTLSYDVPSLVIQYQEPDLTVPTPLEPVVLDFDQCLSRVLPTARAALQSLVGNQASLEACLNCIQAAALGELLSQPNIRPHFDSCKLLRQRAETEHEFSGRLTLTIVAVLLMKADLRWKMHLSPFLVWMFRLAFTLAVNEHDRNIIMHLLSNCNSLLNIIDIDECKEMITLLEEPKLPYVADIFNISTQEDATKLSKRKSRFDTLSPLNLPPKQTTGLTDYAEKQSSSFNVTSINSLLSNSIQSPHTSTTLPQTPFPASQTVESEVSENALRIDPDTIPVGLLATMLKHVVKRSRNLQAPFVPYRPLDPFSIPASLLPAQEPTSYLLERLADLKEDIQLELKSVNNQEMQKNKGTASSVPRPSRENDRERESYSRRSRGDSRDPMRDSNWEKPLAWAQAEMGIAEDGSMLWSGASDGRLGLGAGSTNKSNSSASDTLFDDYRRQRAQRYHQTIAQAHSERNESGERLCFICQKPGHIARECKFGLT